MSKVVRLRSSDQKDLESPDSMILMSKTIQTMVNRRQDDQQVTIQLVGVDFDTLAFVIEWCENHVTKNTRKQTNFVDGLAIEVLLRLLQTASYLDIKELWDHMHSTIAERGKRKALEEIEPTRFHPVLY